MPKRYKSCTTCDRLYGTVQLITCPGCLKAGSLKLVEVFNKEDFDTYMKKERENINAELSLNPDQYHRISQAMKGPTIKVILSQKENSQEPLFFTLHTEYLSELSDYFKALHQFPGQESITNQLILSETCDHPVAFECFVQFIYLGNYSIDKRHQPLDIVVHAMVYVLADRLLCTTLKTLSLQNLATALCSKDATNHCLIELLDLVYRSTASASSARTNDEDLIPAAKEQAYDLDEALNANSFSASVDPASNNIKTNPLRDLISRYAASCLTRLKESQRFYSLVEQYPDLAQEMVLHAGNGTFTV
ncbi:hypothetical protein BJ508DRAFT_362680 [Ascobolus immersus RN42]|uniref:BTB domain-containing protein n=1 Tax=Ascobolus immersus RN42 TaxID=1160509 RepID=A0A3N4I2J6_ASCIM|nr:hypothetical protein BJ508DRAFT_362680 [Ascobolus immersus RN42]